MVHGGTRAQLKIPAFPRICGIYGDASFPPSTPGETPAVTAGGSLIPRP